ncbi:hypothetical protein [Amycolatopsis palatopharyngis]|uniref:hypothetical protein n=1 Tax=Amycolatopsis palatopharyngis TaxID=187982 RepID=UPI000E28376B|nr:hypothetical protein [Amycolatopsis palatopharyngis]
MIFGALRLLVIAGLLGSAWVHLVVWLDWAGDVAIVGPLFLVNVVAGVLIAIALAVWRRHWLPPLAAAGFGAATLGAYLLSLTVGFLGVQEQFRTSAEVWGVLTEVVCVVGGVLLLLPQARRE